MINSAKIARFVKCHLLNRLFFVVVAAVVMTAVVGCEIVNDDLPSYEATSIVKVGDKAPEFRVETIDGEYVAVGGECDDVTLLILFSHTCPDCHNLLNALQSRISCGVATPRIVAVSRGGSLTDITAYRDKNGYTFSLVADPERSVYQLYATMYVPRCYIIDRQGVVRFMTYEYTEGDVDQLFVEAEKY